MKRSYTLARLFVLCFVLFLLHACSKQGDDNNEYVVKEELYGGRVMFSYDYNDKWQLTKWTYTWEATPDDVRNNITTYFYNSDGRLEHTESVFLGSAVDPHREEYFYNNEGKVALIKKYIVKQGSPVFTGMVEYSYSGQQIVETSSNDKGIYYGTTTFTLDDNENIIKKVISGNPSRTEEYLDYDDKKRISRPPFDGVVTSKNNYRKRISTYFGSSSIGYYKYEYNNAGYVTKCIVFGNTSYSVLKFNLIPKK